MIQSGTAVPSHPNVSLLSALVTSISSRYFSAHRLSSSSFLSSLAYQFHLLSASIRNSSFIVFFLSSDRDSTQNISSVFPTSSPSRPTRRLPLSLTPAPVRASDSHSFLTLSHISLPSYKNVSAFCKRIKSLTSSWFSFPDTLNPILLSIRNIVLVLQNGFRTQGVLTLYILEPTARVEVL